MCHFAPITNTARYRPYNETPVYNGIFMVKVVSVLIYRLYYMNQDNLETVVIVDFDGYINVKLHIISFREQGWNSQNFLSKFLIFFVTLGLQILRLK